MRHQRGNKKLGLPTDQRIALLRSLSRSLVLNQSIVTTDSRAKALVSFVSRIITLGKDGSLHARRQALQLLPDKRKDRSYGLLLIYIQMVLKIDIQHHHKMLQEIHTPTWHLQQNHL